MEDYADYDTGGNDDLVQSCLQDLAQEGFDCASVDLLMRMAADGELLDLADVLSGLAAAKHPQDAGEILRMIMFSGGRTKTEPDYVTAAGILTLLVEQNLDSARQICPFLLVYQQQGPDCYDVAFTIGHMVKARKAKQAAQLLKSMISDETPHGQQFKSLVPCLLGTIIDYQHLDWAVEIMQQFCTGQPQPDYSTASWCLAQMVFFRRPDWAAGICVALRNSPPPGYSQEALMQGVGSWGGNEYVTQILDAMHH